MSDDFYSQEKAVLINKENTSIDLSLSANYLKCMEEKNTGKEGTENWKSACETFVENEI